MHFKSKSSIPNPQSWSQSPSPVLDSSVLLVLLDKMRNYHNRRTLYDSLLSSCRTMTKWSKMFSFLHGLQNLHKISQETQFFISLNSLFATFADMHVRKLAKLADLHSYAHAYCSFVLLNEAITTVSGSHCAQYALLIWLFHTIYRWKDTASWK